MIFVVIICNYTHAQHVAINTSGATADASALLDISSSDKGILIPRINLASLTDGTTIASPATSLLVYNINAVLGAGFYYNSNTSQYPVWIKLATGGATQQPPSLKI